MMNNNYIWSISFEMLVQKTIKRDGKRYTWNDFDCVYYCDNGDEEDYIMLEDEDM